MLQIAHTHLWNVLQEINAAKIHLICGISTIQLGSEAVVRRLANATQVHDDVIKWKHFPRYWPFVRGIHRSPVNSLHKSQWRGALMVSLICAWINAWVNNRETGDLRRHRAHYDVIVMSPDVVNIPHMRHFYLHDEFFEYISQILMYPIVGIYGLSEGLSQILRHNHVGCVLYSDNDNLWRSNQ